MNELTPARALLVAAADKARQAAGQYQELARKAAETARAAGISGEYREFLAASQRANQARAHAEHRVARDYELVLERLERQPAAPKQSELNP